MTEAELLSGCIDPHLHVEPSLMERYCDLAEAARLAEAAGYRAIVHKDHHCSSAPVASLVKRRLFPDSKLQIFGSICLNNSVGGISPTVVESAIHLGARIVWLPTASAYHHIEFMKREKVGFPRLSNGRELQETPIHLTDAEGRLTCELEAVLQVLCAHPHVAIGTGHGSPAELDAVIRRCAELGIVDRVFVDHPTEIVGASYDEITRWAKLGATIELIAAQSCPPEYAIPIPALVELIRALSPERVMLASDMGMKKFGDPIAAYGRFLMELYENGLGEAEIRQASSRTAARLLHLEQGGAA